MLCDFNNICPRLKFPLESEENNKINLLGTTLSKQNTLQACIFRKPTTTNSIIPNIACLPEERKESGMIFNKQNEYPINKSEKEKELEMIHNVIYNNECHKNMVTTTQNKNRM